jgi:Fur family zinc uptake transcriptional regulator
VPDEQDTSSGTTPGGEAEPLSRRSHRTPASLDRLVEALLEESNGPLSAYDIVRQARDRQAALQPAQAYRVLARLVRRRRALRIELLSAYILAPRHDRAVMVCTRCQAIQTFPISALMEEIGRHCSSRGFSTTRAVIEMSGLCEECKTRRR